MLVCSGSGVCVLMLGYLGMLGFVRCDLVIVTLGFTGIRCFRLMDLLIFWMFMFGGYGF